MRQLSVLAAAVVLVVVVSAAPPPSPHSTTTTTSTTNHLTPPEPGSPLLRPKRGNPPPPKSATIPYSNYRRVSGVHRYRYPLYRKRNYQPHYEYEEDLLLPEEGNEEEEEEVMDYPAYPSLYNPRPSLFRERNVNQEREMLEALAAAEEEEEEKEQEEEREKKELMLENDGYFHELPEEEVNGPGRVAMNDNYVTHLHSLPYSDLQRLNQMYEYGKRFEDEDAEETDAGYENAYPPLIPPYYATPDHVPVDLPVLPAIRGKTMAPTATGRFYDALSYVRKRATEMRPKYSKEEMPVDQPASVRTKKPQQYLTSAAGRYWRVRDEQQQQEEQQKASSSPSSSIRDPEMMIRRRRKRNTTTTTTTTTSTTPSSPSVTSTTTQATKRRKTINTTAPTRKPKTTTTTTTTTTAATTKPHRTTTTALTTTTTSTPLHRDHRSKRAFSDYFKWEKRGDEEEEEEEEEETDKDISDFLTREYFKSIARSVGQKKRKRMAYAEFEPEVEEDKKRSSPSSALSSSSSSSAFSLQDILNNPQTLQFVQDKLKEVEAVMAREAQGMSEWPRAGSREEEAHREMSNAVLRMGAIQHMRKALGQLQRLQQGRAGSRLGGRREIQLIEEERKRAAAQEEEEEEEEWRRRSMEAGGGNKKRSVRRRLRRGDDIAELFLDNDKEDCPVLWMILHSCSDVSAKVGDEGQVFLPACIKHEICYGCGASQGISGHECDAVLSSALEAACPARSLDCLAAAGSTFSTLSRPGKYDPEGTCAHDPCVIHFLESR